MSPFFKALSWYAMLQLMFVPVALMSGYNFSELPSDGTIYWLSLLQCIIAVITIAVYSSYEDDVRKRKQ